MATSSVVRTWPWRMQRNKGLIICDVAEEIAFLAAVREAERDIEAGRLVTNEQMKARIAEWSGN